MKDQKSIWTIGHSQHAQGPFIALLEAFGIQQLADIRSFPGSRRYPHFNRSALEGALENAGIRYLHFPELGGRQGGLTHAEYSKTVAFQQGVERLVALGDTLRTVYMCAEADWRDCHRRKLSDHLQQAGWLVIHIKNNGGWEEHTQLPVQGMLF